MVHLTLTRDKPLDEYEDLDTQPIDMAAILAAQQKE